MPAAEPLVAAVEAMKIKEEKEEGVSSQLNASEAGEKQSPPPESHSPSAVGAASSAAEAASAAAAPSSSPSAAAPSPALAPAAAAAAASSSGVGAAVDPSSGELLNGGYKRGGAENDPVTGVYDEVEIEDFDYDESTEEYTYPCPCGDKFRISKNDLLDGEDIARCASCSLLLKVIYDPDDLEDD
jgi:diphthamide biosynthesis protein 3